MATKHDSDFQKTIPHPDDSGMYDAIDITFDNSTLTYGGSTGWSYCNTCQQAVCTCITQAPPAPVFAPQSGSVVFTTPNVTVDVEDMAEIIDALKSCVVCGAEDSIVLCSVCKEAVKLARNKWLDEFRKEIELLSQ